ncbi:MAG: linear amide C-N hydrolase [Waddliaceae bacterium]
MCTRVLWNTNQVAVVVGRSMDWPESTEPKIVVFPNGIDRDGGKVDQVVVVKENPLIWKSKYGSVVVTAYGVGTVDGINEKGLGVNLLYLTSADYGKRDASKGGVQSTLWGQYFLDNAATVEEALELMDGIQPVMAEYAGHRSSVHLSLEDASGDSAIIEYVGGELRIYHGKQYMVMTNDPTYDLQLENMNQFDFSQATRDTPLPGNVDPVSRFVRSSYFLQALREPKSLREAIAGVLSIARNASVPLNAPYKTAGTIYDTEYRTVLDLTNRRYFFELTTSPNVIWLELDTFNLSEGAPVLSIDPDNMDLSGDISSQFVREKSLKF